MADEKRERDRATDDVVGNPSHRQIKRARVSIDDGDFISSMPDEILHHILTFIPTDLAIRTSVLSKRWRHVWCETPCLYINDFRPQAIDQTLNSYRAPKIMSFDLRRRLNHTAPDIDSWFAFAMSRNVQKLSLTFAFSCLDYCYISFQNYFYLSSSLEQLNVSFNNMNPRCTVSWKSLRKLSLIRCKLGDESIENILSGSPKLESLRLHSCDSLQRLDLTKSPNLRTLEIFGSLRYQNPGPVEIIAPHIRYLKLTNSYQLCTLANVSSLTEADIDICTENFYSCDADFVQTMVLKMLAKLQNVERITLSRSILQFLSLAELRGVHFPTLKAKILIVKTIFVRSVVPGTARLLQNSPGLKKLIVHATYSFYIQDKDLNSYMDSQGLNPDRCWGSRYKAFPTSPKIKSSFQRSPELLASFITLVLRNAKTLETVVVRLDELCYSYDAKWFEELLRMARTLSHNNNVSILLK